MTDNRFWPLIKASMPFIIAGLLAAGVNISPELQMLLVNNLEGLMLALSGLGTLLPSIIAAVKYKQSAD